MLQQTVLELLHLSFPFIPLTLERFICFHFVLLYFQKELLSCNISVSGFHKPSPKKIESGFHKILLPKLQKDCKWTSWCYNRTKKINFIMFLWWEFLILMWFFYWCNCFSSRTRTSPWFIVSAEILKPSFCILFWCLSSAQIILWSGMGWTLQKSTGICLTLVFWSRSTTADHSVVATEKHYVSIGLQGQPAEEHILNCTTHSFWTLAWKMMKESISSASIWDRNFRFPVPTVMLLMTILVGGRFCQVAKEWAFLHKNFFKMWYISPAWFWCCIM